MALDTLDRIRLRLDHAPSISEDDKRELSTLIEELRAEIEDLPECHHEDARSLVGFAELSAFEVTRVTTSPDLLEAGLAGVRSVIEKVQERHPRLAEVANNLAMAIGRMGF